jgi:hypothetical protein
MARCEPGPTQVPRSQSVSRKKGKAPAVDSVAVELKRDDGFEGRRVGLSVTDRPIAASHTVSYPLDSPFGIGVRIDGVTVIEVTDRLLNSSEDVRVIELQTKSSLPFVVRCRAGLKILSGTLDGEPFEFSREIESGEHVIVLHVQISSNDAVTPETMPNEQ